MTVIIPKNDSQEFLKSLQSGNETRPPLIEIDSPAFTEHFIAYGWHSRSTKEILTPKLIQKTLDFKIGCNKHLLISLIDTRIFLAVKYYEKMFEPKLKSSIMDFQCIQGYFEDLVFFMDVVEEVNSNTKI